MMQKTNFLYMHLALFISVLFGDYYYIAKEDVGVLHSPRILNPLPLMRLLRALMDKIAQEKHRTCTFQCPLPCAIDYFQQWWKG